MKLEMVFIGTALFVLIFGIGVEYFGEQAAYYDTEIDTSTTFGKVGKEIQSVYDLQESSKEQIQGGIVSDSQAADEMVKGGYTAIRNNPFTALELFSNSTYTVYKETPYFNSNIMFWLITSLSTIILFAVIALIFRFRSGN